MNKKHLTIVITTFKSNNKVINCLKTIPKNQKIIVVENSNDDNLKKKLEEKYPNLKCFVSNKNLGYAKGNNLALSKVKTKYALILNPDALLSSSAIQNFFKTTKKIKNFAIIGPGNQSGKKNYKKYKFFIEVETIKGFAMFLNMKEFKKIGFFDQNFFIYLEEIDLCNRLRKENKKIFLDSSIEIYHQGGKSHDSNYNLQMELSRNWHWMWSSFYYTKKHKGYLIALYAFFGKLMSSILKYYYYFFMCNNKKKLIYKQRMLGLANSMIGNSSWYRPKI